MRLRHAFFLGLHARLSALFLYGPPSSIFLNVCNQFSAMTEPLTGTLPPPLPPRNRTVPHAPLLRPTALPLRPTVAYPLQTRRTVAFGSSVEVSVVSANPSK